jgi:hypothetical protein
MASGGIAAALARLAAGTSKKSRVGTRKTLKGDDANINRDATVNERTGDVLDEIQGRSDRLEKNSNTGEMDPRELDAILDARRRADATSSPIIPNDVLPRRIKERVRNPDKTARDIMQDVPSSRPSPDITEKGFRNAEGFDRTSDEFFDSSGAERIRTDFEVDMLDLEARARQRINELESAFEGTEVPKDVQVLKDRLKQAIDDQDPHAIEDIINEFDASGPPKIDAERAALMNEEFFPGTDAPSKARIEAGIPKRSKSAIKNDFGSIQKVLSERKR